MSYEAKSFLTFFVLTLLFYVGLFTNRNLTLTIFVAIILIISILFVLFIVICTYQWATADLGPITDISRYQEALSICRPYTEHFPKEVPTEAIDAIFYYSLGFLQAGSNIQLRIKLLPERIEEIQTLFRKSAKLKYIPGGTNNSPKYEITAQGTIIPHKYCFYTGDTLKYDFPENYEILVLEDERCAPKYKYSRGVWYGIAVEVSTSEVVYWAEIGGG